VAHDLQNRPQTGPEVWMERSDPRLPRPPSHRHRDRPIRYRPGTVWVVLAVAVVLITVGIAVGEVIIVAAGLIVGGTLGRLFDLRAEYRRRARIAARQAAERAAQRDSDGEPTAEERPS